MLGRHSDIQEVHLCNLGEVDTWALVKSQFEFPELMWRYPYKVANHYSHKVLANKEA